MDLELKNVELAKSLGKVGVKRSKKCFQENLWQKKP